MNKLLEQTRQKIESSVPEQFIEPFHSIVTAGRNLMWSDDTFHFVQEYVQGIQGPEEVPPKVAQGVAKALSIIIEESRTPPNMEDPFYAASYPAGMVLGCDALEYIEQEKQIEVTADLVSATTEAIAASITKLYGITPDHMKQAYEESQRTAQAGQPGLMDQAAAPADAPAEAPMEEV